MYRICLQNNWSRWGLLKCNKLNHNFSNQQFGISVLSEMTLNNLNYTEMQYRAIIKFLFRVSPFAAIVSENLPTMFCCKAPEIFCGNFTWLSISMGSEQQLNVHFWVNFIKYLTLHILKYQCALLLLWCNLQSKVTSNKSN